MFLVVATLFAYSIHKAKANCTLPVSAIVVNVVEETSVDSDGYSSTVYYPVYGYVVNGKSVNVQSTVGSSFYDKIELGSTTELRVNPSNVQQFYNPNDGVTKVILTVFSIIGVSFIILSVFLTKMYRRTN